MTLSRLIDTDRNRVGVMGWVSPGAPQLGLEMLHYRKTDAGMSFVYRLVIPTGLAFNASCDHCRRISTSCMFKLHDEKLAG